MPKPTGLRLGLTGEGGVLSLSVSRPSIVEDSVWDAVQRAVEAGWTPTQFLREVREAWEQALDDQRRAELTTLASGIKAAGAS